MARSKGPVMTASILDSLLSMPPEAVGPVLDGFSKVYNLTPDEIREKMDEREDEKASEKFLAGVKFSEGTILGGLNSDIVSMLRSDKSKRFVLTLKRGEDGWVVTPSIQSARGRKPKGE